MIQEKFCLYFKWNDDGKIDISYKKKDNDSLSSYVSFMSVPTRILDSCDLEFFATIGGKNNMFGHWRHWYVLSLSE